jgi:hypothetical protein
MRRNHEYRSGGTRHRGPEDERRYGHHAETDEGDSSVRAGAYDEGRERFGGSEWRERQEREAHDPDGGRYTGPGDFGSGNDIGYGGRGSRDSGRARYGADYGYGRGGRSNYDEERFTYDDGRRFESEGRQGGQFRQSAPGGFGQAQGSSAWRGHGVDEDTGDLRAGNWRAPQPPGGPYLSGPHRGKGPKGYQRSDDRLKEMLCERLRDDPHIDASDVSVSVQNGRVTLDGTVDSRSTKNLIEDVAEQFGVDDVQNNLRVQRPGLAQSFGGESQDARAGSREPRAEQTVGTDEVLRRRSN